MSESEDIKPGGTTDITAFPQMITISSPPWHKVWAFSISPRCPSSLSCINEYLAVDSGGNVSDLVLARNCCLARMLPGEAENGAGMNRSARGWSLKRFKRSNGRDTALYRTYIYLFYIYLAGLGQHRLMPHGVYAQQKLVKQEQRLITYVQEVELDTTLVAVLKHQASVLLAGLSYNATAPLCF